MESWLLKLACPDCHIQFAWDGLQRGELRCALCHTFFGTTVSDPLRLIPNTVLNDSRYWAEGSRYQEISGIPPEEYTGYEESNPTFRAQLIESQLRRGAINSYLNIGPGPGLLEERMGGMEIWALDVSEGFLQLVKERAPYVRRVRGVAEYLPFTNNALECVVSQSTFQSVVDRERMLYEAARVLRPMGTFIFNIAYRWNYPSKPQGGFNILVDHERGTLFRFLRRLGFCAKSGVWNVRRERKVSTMDEGDYLWIHATKVSETSS